MGVLVIRALLFGVYIAATDFSTLPNSTKEVAFIYVGSQCRYYLFTGSHRETRPALWSKWPSKGFRVRVCIYIYMYTHTLWGCNIVHGPNLMVHVILKVLASRPCSGLL